LKIPPKKVKIVGFSPDRAALSGEINGIIHFKNLVMKNEVYSLVMVFILTSCGYYSHFDLQQKYSEGFEMGKKQGLDFGKTQGIEIGRKEIRDSIKNAMASVAKKKKEQQTPIFEKCVKMGLTTTEISGLMSAAARSESPSGNWAQLSLPYVPNFSPSGNTILNFYENYPRVIANIISHLSGNQKKLALRWVDRYKMLAEKEFAHERRIDLAAAEKKRQDSRIARNDPDINPGATALAEEANCTEFEARAYLFQKAYGTGGIKALNELEILLKN